MLLTLLLIIWNLWSTFSKKLLCLWGYLFSCHHLSSAVEELFVTLGP